MAMRETTEAYARVATGDGARALTIHVGTVEVPGPVAHRRATAREIALSKLEWMCDCVARAEGTLDALRDGLGGEPDYVVVDLESLEVKALRGFPGPCVGYMLGVLGPNGVWDVVSHHADRAARHRVILMAKRLETGDVEIFESVVPGEVVAPESDAKRSDGVRTIFKPNNCHRPVAAFSNDVRMELSPRRDAHAQFLAFLDEEARQQRRAKDAEDDTSADEDALKEPDVYVDTDKTIFGVEARAGGRQKSRATTLRGRDKRRESRPTETWETGKEESTDTEYGGKSVRIAEGLHRKLLAERAAWANVLRVLNKIRHEDYLDEGAPLPGVIA